MRENGFCVQKDDAKTIEHLISSSDQSDVQVHCKIEEMYNLAEMYEHGRGVPKDEAKAHDLYKKNCSQPCGNA